MDNNTEKCVPFGSRTQLPEFKVRKIWLYWNFVWHRLRVLVDFKDIMATK